MRAYRIAHDVKGDAYKRLLEAALKEASTFSLVWREALPLAASAWAVRDALRDLQVRHVKSDRWPGTTVLGCGASVITFRAAPSALDTLLKPGSLFAWRSPTFPEDLSFRTEGGVCLATVSHEAEGWILSRSLARAVGQHVILVRATLQPTDEDFS